MKTSKPEAVKRYDNPRPLFPGEPWVAFIGGVAAWLATRKHPSLAMRTLGTFVGAALVARAAHGRKNLSNVMRWTPIGGGIRR
ncbi:MAG: hypothetical protein H0X13_14065 [Ramlibacter sp.]|nr:hypothetical protein [Ramlibacter sp.]